MELKKTKRSIVVLAAALATISTSVMAESTSKAVRLSDAELDSITAAGAQVVLINPGEANVVRVNEDGSGVCINCDLIAEFPKGQSAYGVVTIENKGRGVFTQEIGKWPSF